MNGRNRRGIRRPGMKARLSIAAAVLAGGSAAGVAAVAASHSPATTAAQSASFTLNFHHAISEQQALTSALSTWGSSQQRSLTTLAEMTPISTFSQFWWHRTEFAAQRGVVELATKKFLLVKSAGGQLHLWWLTGATKVKNVSASGTGIAALTGSAKAASTAVTTGNMAPAAVAVAGSTSLVSQLAAPVTKPTTITVETGSQVITITITTTTATVTQPSATTSTTAPAATSTTAPATAATITEQPTFTAAKGVARGDLVFIAGVRKGGTHGSLIAELVLFAVPSSATSDPTATSAPTAIAPTVSGTHS